MNSEMVRTRRLPRTVPATDTVWDAGTVRRFARSALRGALVGVLTSGAMTILAFWLRDGGVMGATTLGDGLTSAGRLTGLLGTYLLLLQLLLMARIPFVEWLVGFDRLTVMHKLNGKATLYFILAHVVLITTGYAVVDHVSILRESIIMLTTYPGMMAAVAGTMLLIGVVGTSLVIVRRRLRYETWFLVHLMAYAALLLAWFHQLPTGNDFLINPFAAAFWVAIYVATVQLIVLFRLIHPTVRAVWHGLRVAEVVREGRDTISIRLTGRDLRWLNARAGQFFLWRFLDRSRWMESHPFSLSAAPDGKSLRITVKVLGDYTSKLAAIRPGTFVVAEGPFGRFVDDERTTDRAALIAGGVGITPIRALAEEMNGDVVIVYRAMSEEDVVFRSELEELARERGMTVRFVLGDHRLPEHARLMSAAHLREIIPDLRSREVYLCGPPGMVRLLERNVIQAGVHKSLIHTEQFAL